MRLNKKAAVGGLDVVTPAHPPTLLGEFGLVFLGEEMFNHQISVYDIKGLNLKGQMSAISYDPDFLICYILPRPQIYEDQIGPKRAKRPVQFRAANIQYPGSRRYPEPAIEIPHSFGTKIALKWLI